MLQIALRLSVAMWPKCDRVGSLANTKRKTSDNLWWRSSMTGYQSLTFLPMNFRPKSSQFPLILRVDAWNVFWDFPMRQGYQLATWLSLYTLKDSQRQGQTANWSLSPSRLCFLYSVLGDWFFPIIQDSLFHQRSSSKKIDPILAGCVLVIGVVPKVFLRLTVSLSACSATVVAARDFYPLPW